MLIVMGEAQAAPGRFEEMLEAVTTMATATKSDEGLRGVRLLRRRDSPEVILGAEVWRDQAAFDAHTSHAQTEEFICWGGARQRSVGCRCMHGGDPDRPSGQAAPSAHRTQGPGTAHSQERRTSWLPDPPSVAVLPTRKGYLGP